MKRTVLTLSLLLLSTLVYPATKRSSSTPVKFIRANACPSTGKHVFPCPGWVVDHIVPLCANGGDTIDNMQWQTRTDSLAKDRVERKMCAQLRKKHD